MTVTKSKVALDKGSLAEECLREYFRDLGSFVLRGVPVREGSEDVTDIDLWVYTRAAAHSRHIAIVDIKNKRRGKAFERAIWIKGLQSALGADEAIIASQGVKDVIHKFSERLAIRVISSSVFDLIVKRYGKQDTRLTAEEINEIWKKTAIKKTNLKARIDLAKTGISRGIDFRTLNVWLDNGAELLRLATEREQEPGSLTRAAYLCCALISVGGDYLGKYHSLSDTNIRRDYFLRGLRYGRSDLEATQTYLDFTEHMVNEFLDSSGSSSAQIRAGFERESKKLPIQGLAEFFSRPHSGFELLKAAVALEEACHVKKVQAPRNLPSLEAKKIIGLISDYAGLNRRDVLGDKEEANTKLRTDDKNTNLSQQSKLL